MYSIAFSPDGETLAIGTGSSGSNGGDTGTVQLWDVATGEQIGSPHTDDTGPVHSVAFSPDGKTLAAGTEGNIPYFLTVQLCASLELAYLVNPVPYLCTLAGQSVTRAHGLYMFRMCLIKTFAMKSRIRPNGAGWPCYQAAFPA